MRGIFCNANGKKHLCEVHDTAENQDTEDIPVVDVSDDDKFRVIRNLKTWLRSNFEDFCLLPYLSPQLLSSQLRSLC